jgi:hypothetical protein
MNYLRQTALEKSSSAITLNQRLYNAHVPDLKKYQQTVEIRTQVKSNIDSPVMNDFKDVMSDSMDFLDFL